MIILELQEQDSKAFEEIVSILQCHPEIEKFELAKERRWASLNAAIAFLAHVLYPSQTCIIYLPTPRIP